MAATDAAEGCRMLGIGSLLGVRGEGGGNLYGYCVRARDKDIFTYLEICVYLVTTVD